MPRPRPSPWTVLALLPALPLLPGCFSLMVDAQAGYTTNTSFDEGRRGLAAQLSGGFAMSEDEVTESFGPGVGLRTKFTDEVKQFAFTPHLYYLGGSGTAPYARLGANLLQLEKIEGDSSFGMFGPYLEGGVFLTPLVLSTFVEYDVRFSDHPNEPFVGVMMGFGAAASSSALR